MKRTLKVGHGNEFYGDPLKGLRHWVVYSYDEHGDAGVSLWIFDRRELAHPGKPVERVARERLEAVGIDPGPHHCSHGHDCCGCAFEGPLSVDVRPRFVIASKNWGRNI